MKNQIQQADYTKKRPALQKIGYIAKWVGLFFVLMLLGLIFGPFFLSNHKQALHLSHIFHHYQNFFWLIHGVFILSALWWWPAYIRHRGKRNKWPQEMIDRAADWKWVVMAMLAILCVLFFIS